MDACEPFVLTGCQRSAFSWTPLSQWCAVRYEAVRPLACIGERSNASTGRQTQVHYGASIRNDAIQWAAHERVMEAYYPFVLTSCQRSAFFWTPLSQWCTFRWPDVSSASFSSVVSPFSRVSPLLWLHDIRTFTAGSCSRWAASAAASMAQKLRHVAPWTQRHVTSQQHAPSGGGR